MDDVKDSDVSLVTVERECKLWPDKLANREGTRRWSECVLNDDDAGHLDCDKSVAETMRSRWALEDQRQEALPEVAPDDGAH